MMWNTSRSSMPIRPDQITPRISPDITRAMAVAISALRPIIASEGADCGVRAARRNELAEDYVELIAELIHSHGEARPVDIAARMGVTAPTVAKTLGRLARDGLITRAKYRSIFLTEQGRALARECRHWHEIVLRFLLSLGLDAETAKRDSEGIEHHLSEQTLELFAAFVARN
jgi:DtxR family transcriptional regulator, manganese transport regulator